MIVKTIVEFTDEEKKIINDFANINCDGICCSKCPLNTSPLNSPSGCLRNKIIDVAAEYDILGV